MDGAFCQAFGEDTSRPQDLPLRIRILCYITGVRRSCIPTIGMQLRGNTRRRRDHRNPHFAAMLPAGAVRMPASRSCRTSATKSPLGLFKEISPKRNFFQRDPRRGSLSLHAALRHANSLLLRFANASRGAAPTPRKPSRRLDPSLVLPCGARFFADITWVSQIFADITMVG